MNDSFFTVKIKGEINNKLTKHIFCFLNHYYFYQNHLIIMVLYLPVALLNHFDIGDRLWLNALLLHFQYGSLLVVGFLIWAIQLPLISHTPHLQFSYHLQ